MSHCQSPRRIQTAVRAQAWVGVGVGGTGRRSSQAGVVGTRGLLRTCRALRVPEGVSQQWLHVHLHAMRMAICMK